MLIKNKHELIDWHADKSTRLVLSALEDAIKTVMPDNLVRQAIRFNKELVVHDIRGKIVRLRKFDSVHVVGAGKAAAGMASAICSILENKVEDGAITIPYGLDAKIEGISVSRASHPVPDESGVRGANKILEILANAQKNDLVFVLISGGGSALMPLASPGVSLKDKQEITNLLLASGASINEINAVRKHLSAVKGGQLLRHVGSECSIVSLILSDVVGDDLEVIASGPTCPDESTFADALRILKKYRIEHQAAVIHLTSGVRKEIKETPKSHDPIFSRVHNMLIGNNAIACKSAVRYLKENGLKAVHIGSEFDGPARDFGRFLARFVSDLNSSKPFAIVAGGETTVRLGKSKSGVGGRNQEAAIKYVMDLTRPDISAAFVGTDGIDGNSDAAGALVSQKTVIAAKKLHLKKYLDSHQSYRAFEKLHSLVLTGYTGTNVNDIAIVCRFSNNAHLGRQM